MPAGRFVGPRRRMLAGLLAAPALVLTGCHGFGSSSPQPTVTVTVPASSSASSTPSSGTGGSSAPSGGEPGIVAVTTAGALVRLDPSSGSVIQTLVPSGVLGDEVSVSPDGQTVYFTEAGGCNTEVESVTIGGADRTAIAVGQLAAVSPDGTKLAYTTQPLMTQTCVPDPAQAAVAAKFQIDIRTLSSGSVQVIGLPSSVRRSQLLPPISHLSWSSDGSALAVSTSAVADNEGWALYIVDVASAKYYVGPNAGVTYIPVTGSPTAQRSYIREGVFLPDGNFFISRACCAGVPIHNTSRLMWEVNVNGELVHQVAIGYPTLDHVSLDSDPTGKWLLYVGGNDLYVSENGNRPTQVATGVIAAAFG
jgi:hypothetical protein